MSAERTTIIPSAISIANAAVPNSVYRLPASAASSRFRAGVFTR